MAGIVRSGHAGTESGGASERDWRGTLGDGRTDSGTACGARWRRNELDGTPRDCRRAAQPAESGTARVRSVACQPSSARHGSAGESVMKRTCRQIAASALRGRPLNWREAFPHAVIITDAKKLAQLRAEVAKRNGGRQQGGAAAKNARSDARTGNTEITESLIQIF